MITVLARCDAPNCGSAEEVKKDPTLSTPHARTDTAPPTWIILDLVVERQGSGGGTGKKIFCSWQCVARWVSSAYEMRQASVS